jgi:hypothetical protein
MHRLCVERRNKGIGHKNIFKKNCLVKMSFEKAKVGNVEVDKTTRDRNREKSSKL